MSTESNAVEMRAPDVDEVLAALDTHGANLPRAAILQARLIQERIIPRLTDALHQAAAQARAGNVPDGNLHFFAFFLLAEFRAKEALPAILEAVCLPGELPFDLFGDAITEDLAAVLAALVDSPDQLDVLISDQSLNEYVRWEAVQTSCFLVRDGRITRDEAVERLRRHLVQAIAAEDTDIIGGLLCELDDFAPREPLEEISEAYRRDLVDPFSIGLHHLEQSAAEGESRIQVSLEHCRETGIADTIQEFEWWDELRPSPAPTPMPPVAGAPHVESDWDDEPEPVATIYREQPRVGRNDPCPCGSGPKYKKCCGAST